MSGVGQVLVAGAMQEGGGLLGLVLCLLGGMSNWAIAVWGMTALVMTAMYEMNGFARRKVSR